MPADTILARLFDQARTRPTTLAYAVKERGSWQRADWARYAAEVRAVAKSLLASGFRRNERVCILGFNRPEWVLMDLGAMCAGGAPAGIYTTGSPEEVAYVVRHTEARIVLAENIKQYEKLRSQRHTLPKLERVVMMRDAETPSDAELPAIGWQAFLELGRDVTERDVDARVAEIRPSDVATLIYTSGTTGPPKGVMLSHDNLAWTARALLDAVHADPTDTGLSYLPLSHIAEQVATIHGPISLGSSVHFAESFERIAENIREVRPTLFFGVPRIWEKMHDVITAKLEGVRGPRRALVTWARKVGLEVVQLRNERLPVPAALAAQYVAADRLVFAKLKHAIGLDRAKICVSGAAPIARGVVDFFASFGLVIHEIYGQSEDTGPTTFNLPGQTRFGTVGKPLPGVEVKLAPDGEILVHGRNVFLGYAREEAATREVLEDGWLRSGDLGELDEAGYLKIVGRKKDILITAGGKNVAPKNIEDALKEHDLVQEAVVIGDARKYLTALVALHPEVSERFAEKRGLPLSSLHESPEVIAAIQSAVDAVNEKLARVEQIKKFRIVPRGFTVESGELTPTLKVKRNVVAKHYAREIESMYAE